ncbi:MAG: hypothetical protein WAL10_28965 [Acetobacteraceae bacterium]|jgi:hypothetical protein
MAFDLSFEVDARGLGTIGNFALRDQPMVREGVARSVVEFDVTIYQQPTCFGLVPKYRLISPRGSIYPTMLGNRFGPVSAGQTNVTFIETRCQPGNAAMPLPAAQ